MAGLKRKPLQGVANIIWFNWHYYAVAILLIGAGMVIMPFLPEWLRTPASVSVLLAASSMVISLVVSCYVYDFSGLYSFGWLSDLPVAQAKTIVNIHAGFDETSVLLRQKFPQSALRVLDFYDKSRHTEISIQRARKAYPAFPGTETITTGDIPLPTDSTDLIFLILAAHEIRDSGERIRFFAQLQNALRAGGKIVVVEHLRDMYNFMAYTFGFFHFYPRSAWRHAFGKAGLLQVEESKITPFLSVFILQKNGTAS
jgi:hypothetical protein